MQRWVVIALVLALAGLSWAVLMWPAPEPEPAAVSVPEAQAESPPPSAAAVPNPKPPEALSKPKPPSAQPAEAPSAPLAAQPPEAEPPLFEHDMGPVAEYKERFGSEPRDSAANDAELVIRDAFKLTDGPNPVFRSVLCRKTLCKIEVRINSDQLGAYVAAMGRLTQHFDKDLAITRTADHAGQVSLDVYAQRRSRPE